MRRQPSRKESETEPKSGETVLGPAAEWVPTASLRPWAKNPRKNDGSPVRKVMDSIRRFGFGAPILARRADGEVIAGHTRLKAAIELGLERVPVRFLDLDPADAHLLALADNRSAEEAEWDDDGLAAILAELREQGQDLTATAFDEEEISQFLEPEEGGPPSDPEMAKAALLRTKWGVETGQRWLVPSRSTPGQAHAILCGDSTAEADVARLMGDERAHMMWTDPPYGVAIVGGDHMLSPKDRLAKGGQTIENDAMSGDELRAFLLMAFRQSSAALQPGAAVYVAHPSGPIALEFLLAFREVGWRLHQTLVWKKDRFVLGHSDYHYAHEPILFGYVSGPGRHGRGANGWYGDNAQSSVFEVPRPSSSEEHPTMKPVELVAPMIRNSSPVGGLVYEPFSGSGTTLVAAETTGRLCRAIELDPKYVAVALERLSAMGLEPRLDG